MRHDYLVSEVIWFSLLCGPSFRNERDGKAYIFDNLRCFCGIAIISHHEMVSFALNEYKMYYLPLGASLIIIRFGIRNRGSFFIYRYRK